MTKPINQHKLKEPELRDPHSVPEVFANEVSTVEVDNGIVRLTLSSRRMKAANNKTPEQERVVTSRIALPTSAIDDMINKLFQLRDAMNNHQAISNLKTGEKPN